MSRPPIEEAEALELSPLDELNGLTVPVMQVTSSPMTRRAIWLFGGAFVVHETPLVDPYKLPVRRRRR